jgi:hypothetical protein
MYLSAVSLDAFEPVPYLQLLAAVAAVDGTSDEEAAFLQRQASGLGVDLAVALAAGPKPLGEVAEAASETTRRIVYRDCFMLAHADGVLSAGERALLDDLQRDLRIPPETAADIEAWAERLSRLLTEASVLFGT